MAISLWWTKFKESLKKELGWMFLEVKRMPQARKRGKRKISLAYERSQALSSLVGSSIAPWWTRRTSESVLSSIPVPSAWLASKLTLRFSQTWIVRMSMKAALDCRRHTLPYLWVFLRPLDSHGSTKEGEKEPTMTDTLISMYLAKWRLYIARLKAKKLNISWHIFESG